MALTGTFTYAGASPASLVVPFTSFRILNLGDLLTVGPSVGPNTRIGGTEGRLGRDRSRDEAAIELTWVIEGMTDIAGSTSAVSLDEQVRANFADLTRWFDAAPGKEVTVTVADSARSWEGSAHHQEWGGRLRWRGTHAEVSQLVIIAAGLLPELTS